MLAQKAHTMATLQLPAIPVTGALAGERALLSYASGRHERSERAVHRVWQLCCSGVCLLWV